jgi:hypothetical protein
VSGSLKVVEEKWRESMHIVVNFMTAFNRAIQMSRITGVYSLMCFAKLSMTALVKRR